MGSPPHHILRLYLMELHYSRPWAELHSQSNDSCLLFLSIWCTYRFWSWVVCFLECLRYCQDKHCVLVLQHFQCCTDKRILVLRRPGLCQSALAVLLLCLGHDILECTSDFDLSTFGSLLIAGSQLSSYWLVSFELLLTTNTIYMKGQQVVSSERSHEGHSKSIYSTLLTAMNENQQNKYSQYCMIQQGELSYTIISSHTFIGPTSAVLGRTVMPSTVALLPSWHADTTIHHAENKQQR